MLDTTMRGAALQDFAPNVSTFTTDIMNGLRSSPRTLPCKYFYDALGSKLFDRICELPEYYPTQTEMNIMRANSRNMAALLKPGTCLIEYGSGSSLKTRLLLNNAVELSAYIPVDISHSHLIRSAEALASDYPQLSVKPVCADYTTTFSLPSIAYTSQHNVVYFPGSTIGNFHPDEAAIFLEGIIRVSGKKGGLLIGVDLKKDPRILERAYNDSRGVTAEFSVNLLRRINNTLAANFDLDQWEHQAFYNAVLGRIEMHLLSTCNQDVQIGSSRFEFNAGETIHTENSYKYTVDEFSRLAMSAGWRVQNVWTDQKDLFSIQYLTAA